jgi:hypothetical protein
LACGLAARRDLDDLDAGVVEHGVEGCSELSGSVADQEPELSRSVAEVGDEVAGLLRRPGSVWFGGGAKDVDVAGVDLDHEEHVDPPQRHGAVDVEEVACERGRRLSAQELSPGRPVSPCGRGRYP